MELLLDEKSELEKKLKDSYHYFYNKVKDGNLDEIDKHILMNIDRKYEKFLYK